MGIHANAVPFLTDLASYAAFSGIICTLGVQDLPDAAEPAAFYRTLGFSRSETLDLPGVAGVDHAFDLNEDELPPHLLGRFDVVLNGGTLEHVFHLPNALTSMTRMLRAGGHVIHLLPCNGWVDHGFYQISPTFMFDYYAAAGFRALESVMFSFDLSNLDRWLARPIGPGDLGSGLAGSIDRGIHLYLFAAQRGDEIAERPRPLQGLYAGASTAARPRWFLPCSVERGERRQLPLRATLDLTRFQRDTGHCWVASIPKLADVADTGQFPARSPLLLLENGAPLGPPHTEHRHIREAGCGRFSHWGEAVYLSTSDNSDPTANGRKYTAIAPAALSGPR